MSTATISRSDSHLTRRAAGGSSRAFETIFERYHQELYRYCAAILGNATDAQDAVQSTMVKVLQALPGEKRQIELKPWLYRIAHNESIEIIRRRVPSEEVDADSLLGPASTADEVLARERLRHLVADVAELPERQRGALVMRELGGLGFEAIGVALGTSAATARQTVFEARLGLRQMDEGREMECVEAMQAISGGDRRVLRGRKLRAHLRACGSCHAFRAEIEDRRAELAMLAPLPAAAVGGLLQGVLGAGGGTGGAAGAAAGGGASAAGTAGALAGKSLLSATALKTAAAVGVLVAIGVTAADQRGVIHLGSGPSEAAPAARPAPAPATARPAAGPQPRGTIDRADAPGAGPGAGAKGRRGLSSSRPANGTAVAGGAAPGTPRPHAPTQVPESVAPRPADNGRHLGQLQHPDHGNGAAKPEPGHGKPPSPPGQAKPKPAKHGAASDPAGSGQAKQPAAEKKQAATAAEAKPEHPSPPEKQAGSPGSSPGSHGEPGAAGPPFSE